MTANLYLIPTLLGDDAPQSTVTPLLTEICNQIDYFVVENIRNSRRSLRKLGYTKDLHQTHFFELSEHTKEQEITHFLQPAENGFHIGLLSEAGCPAVADPGAMLVALAHKKNIRVVPLVGASSILLSLMASGLNGQSFAFVGYLPVNKPERVAKIKQLESLVFKNQQTQIFIEVPYRNSHLIEDLLSACQPNTKLCIAADLTLETEWIKTKTIAEWTKQIPNIGKRPAIFLIGK